MRQPVSRAARPGQLCSLSFGWKNPARDGEPRVWRTGGISRSVTVPSKRNGTSHPPDNSRALVNVLMEDVKRVCVCVERECKKQTKCCFCFSDYANGLGTDQILKEGKVVLHGPFGRQFVEEIYRQIEGNTICGYSK